MDEIVSILKSLLARVETLERNQSLSEVVIPTGGKLVVDSLSSDPPAQDGRIYYNTVTNKYKVCENALWKTITTT